MLERFNNLSKKLSQAINQQNYTTAKQLILKQHKLIQEFEFFNNTPSEMEIAEDWSLILNKYRKLRETLEEDLKKLNTNTRDNLKRLKGYAR